MGWFGEIWIAELTEKESSVGGRSEYIMFDKPTYISWESKGPPARALPGIRWVSKGKGTVFIQEGNQFQGSIETELSLNVTLVKEGLIRKQLKYEFQTKLSPSKGINQSISLFHLVLPESYIPDSFDPVREFCFVKKSPKNVAMTWPFNDVLPVRFRFRKVNEDDFDEYKSAGVPRTERLNEHLKGEISDQTRSFLAEVLVESMKP